MMAQPFTGETYLGLPGTAIYRRGSETRGRELEEISGEEALLTEAIIP